MKRNIKLLEEFNYQDFQVKKEMSTEERDSLITYIISNIGNASDTNLITTAQNLDLDLKSVEDLKFITKFRELHRDDWEEMSPDSRKSWVLSINPDMDKTPRGNSFLNMITHNNWSNARANIKNFMESLNVSYIKKLVEGEGDFIKPIKGYVNKTNRDELLIAIYKSLNYASDETLKDIYQTLVVKPAESSLKKPIDVLIGKIKEVGEEIWNSWTDMTRNLFLIRNSPVSVKNFETKNFYKVLSRSTYKSILTQLPGLLDLQSKEN